MRDEIGNVAVDETPVTSEEAAPAESESSEVSGDPNLEEPEEKDPLAESAL